eukprot:266530-Amphidinium_carterae.1
MRKPQNQNSKGRCELVSASFVRACFGDARLDVGGIFARAVKYHSDNKSWGGGDDDDEWGSWKKKKNDWGDDNSVQLWLRWLPCTCPESRLRVGADSLAKVENTLKRDVNKDIFLCVSKFVEDCRLAIYSQTEGLILLQTHE